MKFTLFRGDAATQVDFPCKRLYIVGYAGRAQESVMAHIRELEQELGVPAPPHIPMIYPCGTYLLTHDERACVPGQKTCGEAEPVLLVREGTVYVGLGSDHTDRELETTDVLCAKQLCPKPVSRALWLYDEVKAYWDTLRMRSYQTVDGEEKLYQSGTLESILPVESILSVLRERGYDLEESVIFCGTLPLQDGFRFEKAFRAELIDDTLGRRLDLSYELELAKRDE